MMETPPRGHEALPELAVRVETRSDPPPPRLRAEDLVIELFEAMHALHFVSDAVAAGDFCLRVCEDKLPNEAGLVHLYDVLRREFVVTSARGSARLMLLQRHAWDDPLLAMARRTERAFVVDAALRERLSAMGRVFAVPELRSAVVAPIFRGRRLLGAIELINRPGDEPFDDSEASALSYVGDHLGRFVADHGASTDPTRILPHDWPLPIPLTRAKRKG